MRFKHIICDWPWWYANRLTGKNRTKFGGGAPAKYHCEKVEAAPEFKVQDLADPAGCMLYFWVTGPHLFDAQTIIETWGFHYTTIGFNWVKTLLPKPAKQVMDLYHEFGMVGMMKQLIRRGPGHYTASNTELCLLAWYNRPLTNIGMENQIILAPITTHSRKPLDVHKYIDKHYPGSDCVELFAVPSLYTDEYISTNRWRYLGFDVDGEDMRTSIPRLASE